MSSLAAAPATGVTAIQVWTLVAAGLAVLATVLAAWLLRRTGKGTVDAAKQAAAASERSAEAAEKSAQAAQDAVAVNRENAATITKRAEADAYAKRYQDAAGQLGHEKATVRVAGVYAMARLADDWPEERQTCVDVLTAYLRMRRHEDADGETLGIDDQVRASVQRVIGDHTSVKLRGSTTSWSGLSFDLRDARLRDLDWTDCVFETEVQFAGATFLGECEISGPTFATNINFNGATIEGWLRLLDLTVSHRIELKSVTVRPEGALSVKATDLSDGGWLLLNWIMVEGGEVHVELTRNPGDEVQVELSYFIVGGTVVVQETASAQTNDGESLTTIPEWSLHPGSRVELSAHLLNDSEIWAPRKVDPEASVAVHRPLIFPPRRGWPPVEI
jgi:hypothetical protein